MEKASIWAKVRRGIYDISRTSTLQKLLKAVYRVRDYEITNNWERANMESDSAALSSLSAQRYLCFSNIFHLLFNLLKLLQVVYVWSACVIKPLQIDWISMSTNLNEFGLIFKLILSRSRIWVVDNCTTVYPLLKWTEV